MMHDVINKSPREWTAEQRRYVFEHQTEFVAECMRLCDHEIEVRKMLKFITSKATELRINT